MCQMSRSYSGLERGGRVSGQIPLVDLRAQYKALRGEIGEAISRVLESTDFILGPEVKALEEAFAGYLGARCAVGTSSGTSALMLALRAVGVGAGDEVITTTFTFTATAEAIWQVGARPVFVDIDPETLLLDTKVLEGAVTDRTRAIIPVHLYGNPCPMDEILSIAQRHGLKVIEDAAQAHGATYKGKPVGTWGDVGCFSFYPGKNLGAYGDAGAVVTNEEWLARRVKLLLNHGRTTKYEHIEVGYGERLDTLQAAVLLVKLSHLTEWTTMRRRWAARYDEALARLGVPFVVPTKSSEPVYHVYATRVENRDRVLEGLRSRGIQAGVHYPIPLHLQPAYRYLGYQPGQLPVAERAAKQELSLPLYPELGEDGVERVLAALEEELG